MATRGEKEKQKAQQEKFQALLSNLLKDEDNKYCVDCDAKGNILPTVSVENEWSWT